MMAWRRCTFSLWHYVSGLQHTYCWNRTVRRFRSTS